MHFDRQVLRELKRRLLNEKELGRIMEYFLDYAEQNVAMVRASERGHHELLETVVRTFAVKQMQISTKVLDAKPLTVFWEPAEQFYHGVWTLGPAAIVFIYFDDLKRGCIEGSEIGKPMSCRVRFTTLSDNITPPSPPVN